MAKARFWRGAAEAFGLVFRVRQSKRGRAAICALIGWLTLAANQPEPAKPNLEPDHRVGDALTNISATLERQEKDAQRSPDKQPCQGVPSDKKSDLCAQWTAAQSAAESAKWAKYSTGLALVSLAFGAFSLVALLRSLRQTEESLKIAQQSANAAEEQARDTRELSIKELRARIIIDYIRIPVQQDRCLTLHVRIKNYGPTPARDIKMYINVGGGEWPLDFEQIEIPAVGEGGDRGQAPLPANEPTQFTYYYPNLGRATWDEIIKRCTNMTDVMYFKGKVTYLDDFDRERVSYFCCYLGGPFSVSTFNFAGEQTYMVSFAPTGNRAE